MNRRDFLKSGIGAFSLAMLGRRKAGAAGVEMAPSPSPVDLGPVITDCAFRACPSEHGRTAAQTIRIVAAGWCIFGKQCYINKY